VIQLSCAVFRSLLRSLLRPLLPVLIDEYSTSAVTHTYVYTSPVTYLVASCTLQVAEMNLRSEALSWCVQHKILDVQTLRLTALVRNSESPARLVSVASAPPQQSSGLPYGRGSVVRIDVGS
jgi:hypothetical protein